MITSVSKKYWAFISYSSKDRKWGKWLHNRLENYPIPKEFQGTELFDGAVLGKDLKPCFRDRDELSGSADLGPAIEKALNDTRYLIVLCSTNSAKSKWVNKEIEDFKKIGGERKILALILDGEPNSGGDTECFPPALRYPAEPLAGDMRKEGDGKERGFLKVLSGIAQLDFDVLYRRHERAQRKKRLILGGIAGAVVVSLAALSLFAFQQKGEAEKQTVIAQEKETEANYERDQARKTLSKFYADRAIQASGRTSVNEDESLAWALKAAEVDSEILKAPDLAAKIKQWLGSIPAPTSCLGTGAISIARPGRQESVSLALTQHQRLVVQTGKRSWHLIDWDSRKIVTAESFPAEIEQIIESQSGEWFGVMGRSAGRSQIEIRSWATGELLFHSEEDVSNLRISMTSDGFIAAAYQWSSDEALIYQVSERSGAFAVTQITKLEGEVSSLAVHDHDDEQTILFVIESKKNPVRRLECLRKASARPTWESLPLNLPENLNPLWLDHYRFPIPSDSAILVRGSKQPMLVIDLKNLEFHSSEVPEGSFIIGFMRSAGKLHRISRRKSDDKRSYQFFQTSLPNGDETPLFGGYYFSRWSLCPKGEAVCAWDEQRGVIGYQKISEEARWFPFNRAPGNWRPGIWEIEEFSERFILIRCSRGVGHPIIVLDLSRSDEKAFFLGGSSQYKECLEITPTKDSFSAVFLSHRGMGLSFYDELLPYTKLSMESATRSWDVAHHVEWLNVDNEGQTKALVSKREESQKSVSYLSEPQQVFDWHLTPWRNVEELTSLPSNHILLTAYEKSQLISPNGKIIWEGHPRRAKLILSGEHEYLFREENGRFILSDIPSGKEKWNLKSVGIVLDLLLSKTEKEVLVLSKDFGHGFGAEKPFFSLKLKRISIESGEIETVIWHAPKESVNTLSSYGHTFQLLHTDPIGVVHSSRDSSGDEQYRLLQAREGVFEQTLEWTNAIQVSVKSFHLLSDGSFFARTTQATETEFSLTHFQNLSGEWAAFKISLPSSLRAVTIDPLKSRAVIQCEKHDMLYDFNEHKMVGNHLKNPRSYDGKLGSVELTWASAQNRFYAWGYHDVVEFDATTGKMIQTLRPHHREGEIEIESIAISSEGDWLSTGDNKGQIVTSKLTQSTPNIDDLRKRSHFLGGLKIINDDDLEQWVPPLIGE